MTQRHDPWHEASFERHTHIDTLEPYDFLILIKGTY